jgi:catechol 2,3-dioxygenase-like lactoylglutathione lyase family enzyme
MIDHISIGVRDIARSKRFYDAALAPLGYACQTESEAPLRYGGSDIALWISATAHPVPADDRSGLHICFTAPTWASVDAFHAAALGTGGKTMVGPASGPTMAPTTNAAFVIDRDGYRIEAYCGS